MIDITPPASMDDLKPWWTSKAIWTGLIGVRRQMF